MSTFEDATYGDRIADVYDEHYSAALQPETDASIEFLAALAKDGPALELGIGTGRVALPLAARGIEVHGIDASEAMVRQLREKPGGDAVRVTIGSFADFDLPERFPLVYVVFNTFFVLRTQEEQVSCFRAVARHLTPDGVFVVRAFVPDVSRFDAHNQRLSVETVSVDDLTLEASEHDPFGQTVTSQHVVIRDGSIRMYPVTLRYAYPSELDLMAALAGLSLRERWADWGRTPYPSKNWLHVSVFERSASP